MTNRISLLVLPLALVLAGSAQAEPEKCQRTVTKQMQKLAKKQLQQLSKCLDKENVEKIPGPCPDATTNLKIAKAVDAATAKIVKDCTMGDLATLGFPGDCEFEAAAGGVEAGCFALPVTTTSEFAACLQCWQGAEISELVATLYASHANEICGDDLTDTSPVCSALEHTTPLPDQGNVAPGGEADCQKAIGKGGFKYLLLREKHLANCGLKGETQANCLADPVVQLKLDKASLKLDAIISKKCGNRAPVASPPFCCRSGGGNSCVAAATRDDCENNLGGTVQEGKVCGGGGTCENPPGNQKGITWWESCPEGGAALADLDDLKVCIETASDTIVDELLCWTLPANAGADWPCPAEP